MSLKISYLDHFVTCCYVIKKATALFEIQPFFDLFELSKNAIKVFRKILPRKKPSLMYNFFKKFPFFLRKTKKNTPKMQKRYTCHVSYKKFISINNLICSTLPIQTRYSLSNLIKFNNQFFCFAFIHFRLFFEATN